MRKLFLLFISMVYLLSLQGPIFASTLIPSSFDEVGMHIEDLAISEGGNLSLVNDLGMDLAPLWIWSALAPGLGQVLMGYPLRGYFFLLGNALVFPASFLTGYLIGTFSNPQAGAGNLLLPLVLGGVLQAAAYIWNIYDANNIYVQKLLEHNKRAENLYSESISRSFESSALVYQIKF